MFAERGAAEAVDALVVVADDGHVGAWRAGQQLDELELGVIGVLELVDQDVPVALPLGGAGRRGGRAAGAGPGSTWSPKSSRSLARIRRS